MVEAMSHSTELRFDFQRPVLSTHFLEKHDHSWGVELQYLAGGTSLLVANVQNGAVKMSGLDIQAGDRIVATNGMEGDAQKLIEEVRSVKKLTIVVARCFATQRDEDK